jgi:hypothetical protein
MSQRSRVRAPHGAFISFSTSWRRPINCQKRLAVPGFEPGSSGSQPLMLTTTLYHHIHVARKTNQPIIERSSSFFFNKRTRRAVSHQKIGEAGYRSLCLMHAKHALYHLSYVPICRIPTSASKFIKTRQVSVVEQSVAAR